ncbi:hypothetical protein M1P56_18090 [Streptomyces sp. HU2014]|uniref:IucA/IucC family protein n=1 Tax=Streptomyces sp. HU2014 TaxID=2939414 RepID=UPI00200C8A2F|nr:IucA/IucC family protein [Streptomyces sp. HU2014]UQI46114.1 hypothetical protein M1P56_18090 [Streptomyces sp. HU2014]
MEVTSAGAAVRAPHGERPHEGEHDERAAELVMRDLVDTLVQENLYEVAHRRSDRVPADLAARELGAGESWFRLDLAEGWVCFRARPVSALQSWRFSRGPVWHGGPARLTGPAPDGVRTLRPAELLGLLQADADRTPVPGEAPAAYAHQVLDDLRTAVEHTAATLAARRRLLAGARPATGAAEEVSPSGVAGAPAPARTGPAHPLLPRPHCLLAGERLASLRNRPFHPTARAATGWTADDATRYGPLRAEPMPLAWVAVPREGTRRGSAPASESLHRLLLTGTGSDSLLGLMERHHVDLTTHQPLPVHPWQYDHVLAGLHRAGRATPSRRDPDGPVPLTPALGAFQPTASLRSLATASQAHVHVKLPLSVTTLGVPRLLVPGDLDNGERAESTMRAIADRDPGLRALAGICDERTWAGWSSPGTGPAAAVRPGELAAQVRLYPREVFDGGHRLVLPMAALAAHEWHLLGPLLARARSAKGWGAAQALEFFGELADAFLEMGVGFLRHGVLPELHGQNVVVVLEHGVPRRFVLRDHDTLRFTPGWMAAAGLPDPGYRIKPGDPDSVCLPTGRQLVGFLQTLGLQVNLYGIADALSRAHGIDETAFWKRLALSVDRALDRVGPPSAVADAVRHEVLRAPVWPSRLVLGPLLREGRSRQVTMPAGVGRVPNPLLPAAR